LKKKNPKFLSVMVIGIDAKWYFNGNPSGKVVVKNIVNEILKLDLEHEIILFLQKKDRKDSYSLERRIEGKKNIKIVYCLSTFNFLSNIFILPFYAKTHHVDVCLVQNFGSFLFHKSINYVTYVHDFLFLDYPQFFSKVENLVYPLMNFLLRYSNKVITISNSEKQRINDKSKFPLNQIYVVYHGISDDFSVKNRISLRINLPEEYLLYVGRINVRKNIKIIIDALKDVSEEIKLVIVGGKDNKSFDIHEYVKKNGLENRVILLGHLEYKKLLVVIAKAKLFVFPSRAEGFGLPPLEAMKSGVPVLVSNATSLPEVCGDAAYFFEPTNREQLVEGINKFWFNKELRAKFVKKGLVHVDNFKWTNSARKIINILLS
jgi:glycosyltransferase involved in cell wall biosynthesis